MLQPPRRSVTRFFIPLVDVMMLLFCIFLLMPMVKFEGIDSPSAKVAALEEELLRKERELRRQREELDAIYALKPESKTYAALLRDLQAMREEKVRAVIQRMLIRVLEINGTDGRLYYKNPNPIEIRNREDARLLIEQDRRELLQHLRAAAQQGRAVVAFYS